MRYFIPHGHGWYTDDLQTAQLYAEVTGVAYIDTEDIKVVD